jgi:hypothetical protein
VTSAVTVVEGSPKVRLDFDDYDDWSREDQEQVPDWWDLADLAGQGYALAA